MFQEQLKTVAAEETLLYESTQEEIVKENFDEKTESKEEDSLYPDYGVCVGQEESFETFAPITPIQMAEPEKIELKSAGARAQSFLEELTNLVGAVKQADKKIEVMAENSVKLRKLIKDAENSLTEKFRKIEAVLDVIKEEATRLTKAPACTVPGLICFKETPKILFQLSSVVF